MKRKRVGYWLLACMLIVARVAIAEPLTTGATGDAVRALQARLLQLDYLTGDPDGGYGENTYRAVWVFQYMQGIPPTGAADADTLLRIHADDAQPAKYPALAYASESDAVATLQERLRLLGFYTGDADGQYGRATVNAVKALQEYMQATDQITDADKLAVAPGVNGVADPLLQAALYAASFPIVPTPMREGDEGVSVYRLQRRLAYLDYLHETPDGGYGANTRDAVKALQERLGVKPTGIADEKTLTRLFAADAPEPVKQYQLIVRLAEQKIYVYARDKDGAYTQLKHTIPCSTGTRAIPGTYADLTGPGGEWLTDKDYAARYPFRVDAKLFIHSLPYDQKEGTPDRAYLKSLGKPILFPNIVVSEENARLIWSKCRKRTTVVIA